MRNNANYHVAVLGASANPERYSNKAVVMLLEHGYRVTPVNPSGAEIQGIISAKSLEDINGPVDTLTMYVNAERSTALQDNILKLNPKRIIFNPGSENSKLEEACLDAGIMIEQACTLVLLQTGQFT